MYAIPGSDSTDPALFRTLLEECPDAVIYADREGAIQVWNAAAERIFGHAASDVVGRSLDVIIPERLRNAHWQGFRKALESGETQYSGRVLTTRSVHKNGNKLYVDLGFSLIRGGDGAVMGALATARDCTARYDAERALRARVSELEQKLEAASRA